MTVRSIASGSISVMNMKKILFLLVSTGILISFISPQLQEVHPAIFGKEEESFGIQRFREKREAPPFSLKTLQGNQITLADLKGKPTLLTFWASYCGSCKEEMPVIEKFSAGKRDDLNIFTMVIDGENVKRVQRFVKGSKITLPVILDIKERVARSYGVRMVPTTFLIDRDGIILGMIVGERDWSLPEVWPTLKEVFNLPSLTRSAAPDSAR